MNEPADAAPATAATPTAGRLLREAREKQGLHIAALAASIKVTQKKLELLEADRLDELPDATFTRALAQTVCRALKIDPAPVLALLPRPAGQRLESVGSGLNAPFRERPGALVQREGMTFSFGPWFWITGLVVLAAVAVLLVPSGTIRMPAWGARPVAAAASEPAVVSSDSAILPGETVAASGAATAASGLAVAPAPAVADAGASTTGVVVGVSSATGASASGAATAAPAFAAPASSSPLAASAAFASASPAASTGFAEPGAPSGVLQVRASEATWIEITDARGHPLVSRLVQPGEALGVDGEAPFRLRIGNAGATRVSFRGRPMELAAYTRDNVARFELK